MKLSTKTLMLLILIFIPNHLGCTYVDYTPKISDLSKVKEEVIPEAGDKPESFTDHTSWSEHTCLALNIYHEARSEGELGMKLVAQVTLNRVASKKSYMKDTICEVVKTRNAFEWFSDGKSDIPRNPKAWEQSKRIATQAMNGDFKNLTSSKYFKVCTVDSGFFDKLVFRHKFKRHCFYSEE